MTKSNGPDCISARMLKITVGSITPAVTKLFNRCQLNQVNYQMNGNLPLLLQYLNQAINLNLQITIQYLYYLLIVNYWKGKTYTYSLFETYLKTISYFKQSVGFHKGKSYNWCFTNSCSSLVPISGEWR